MQLGRADDAIADAQLKDVRLAVERLFNDLWLKVAFDVVFVSGQYVVAHFQQLDRFLTVGREYGSSRGKTDRKLDLGCRSGFRSLLGDFNKRLVEYFVDEHCSIGHRGEIGGGTVESVRHTQPD